MNKKSLKEMFEFFPNANWISQDKGRNGLISIHIDKPEKMALFFELDHWLSSINNMSGLDRKLCQIDWGNRKTWISRCISRKEVMG